MSLMAPGAKPLVLASESAARAGLLDAAGLRFEARPARIDEDAVKQSAQAEGVPPADAALLLAELKAARVREPGAVVIGADQLLVCEGAWFDKPDGMDDAREHLRRLRGREHRLVTAVAAMLLTFGAINTYLAGGARLGGRHGLTGLLVLCALLTAVTLRWHVELDTLMRVASTALAAVTAAGLAAAVKLLRSRTAAFALGCTSLVLAFSGVLLAVPLVIGVAALVSVRVGAAAPAGRSSS